MATARQGTDRQPNYEGQYVALSSSKGDKVIASGQKFGTVFDAARKQGETIPTIVYVPKDNGAYFY